jgi:hypothetical protein
MSTCLRLIADHGASMVESQAVQRVSETCTSRYSKPGWMDALADDGRLDGSEEDE